jgi:hypothetical protein
MGTASKNILVITGITAVVIIGFIAILWILGIGNFDELKNTLFKTIGTIVVLATVGLVIVSIVKLAKHNTKE